MRVLHLPVHRQAVGYNVYMRLARQRVQFNVVGSKEYGLVLLPRLLLVEHVADGVGG